MGKFDIDDILSELGVGDSTESGASRQRESTPDDDPTKHLSSVDDAEESFTNLPAVPSGQRSFEQSIVVSNDPAVPVKPKETNSSVGNAFNTVYQPGEIEPADRAQQLGEYLVAFGAVSPKQLTIAEQVIKQSPGRELAEVLIEQGAPEEAVYRGAAALANVQFETIDQKAGLNGGFDGDLLQKLTFEFCKENLVIPIRREGSRIVMGVVSPDDVFLLDEIRRHLGVNSIKMVIVAPSDIAAALEQVGSMEENEVDLDDILSDVDEGDIEIEKKSDSDEVDLEQRAGESPVIRYVNYIIQTAIKEGASDIHIEPAEKRVKVRFRIDGVLYEMMNPPVTMGAAITSRIKIMANLDISERRMPQDGRIRCTVQGRKLDLRVSTLPTGYGEKTVMRILDTRSINVQLEDLGFGQDSLKIWKGQIKEPHGVVLVTGPTGSGKTTTLYSSLRQIDKNALNISTVEDPIEYHLDGITQTQVHEKIGMNFAAALRSLLRQDPDVIMVGEIRDHETAHIAVQAALTGHLVLSTLHTNDAPSSITRLVNIGLEPFLVGAAVNAVLAQRLLRRLCKECKEEQVPSEDLHQVLQEHDMDTDKMWAGVGCDRCRNTGYSGRVGIYEMLTIDDEVRDIVARNPNVAEFRKICVDRGMVSLRADGMAKVKAGLTSLDEVFRVTEGGH